MENRATASASRLCVLGERVIWWYRVFWYAITISNGYIWNSWGSLDIASLITATSAGLSSRGYRWYPMAYIHGYLCYPVTAVPPAQCEYNPLSTSGIDCNGPWLVRWLSKPNWSQKRWLSRICSNSQQTFSDFDMCLRVIYIPLSRLLVCIYGTDRACHEGIQAFHKLLRMYTYLSILYAYAPRFEDKDGYANGDEKVPLWKNGFESDCINGQRGSTGILMRWLLRTIPVRCKLVGFFVCKTPRSSYLLAQCWL